jgi:hypothetical protein
VGGGLGRRADRAREVTSKGKIIRIGDFEEDLLLARRI